MSVATVRAAVQTWLAGTNGLSACFKGQPFVTGTDQFEANGIYGPVAFVHIEHFSETRISLPFGTGLKEVTYDVGVVLIVRHIIQPDEGPNMDGWVDDVDTAVDNMRERIRQDYMFGTNGAVVWQAGGELNDIAVTLDLPKFMGNLIENWVLLQFKVKEEVQA